MEVNGKGLKFEFEVRQFSNTAIEPFDIVFKDYRENEKYSEPNVTFATAQDAEKYKKELESKFGSAKMYQYILNHWIYEGTL